MLKTLANLSSVHTPDNTKSPNTKQTAQGLPAAAGSRKRGQRGCQGGDCHRLAARHPQTAECR